MVSSGFRLFIFSMGLSLRSHLHTEVPFSLSLRTGIEAHLHLCVQSYCQRAHSAPYGKALIALKGAKYIPQVTGKNYQ